jgi:hypothetical protein
VSYWWLSFADATRPAGSQGLGACVVEADDYLAAVIVAHAEGCNPGGECLGWELPRGWTPKSGMLNTLKSREEWDALGAETATLEELDPKVDA